VLCAFGTCVEPVWFRWRVSPNRRRASEWYRNECWSSRIARRRRRFSEMTRALLIVVMVASVAGCATIQASETRSTEQLLAAAGFHMEVAATPEELAELRMVPARKIVARASPGTTSYVYPDPDGCRCLYVGGEPQYQEYQRL